MRAVVQRVSEAQVRVGSELHAAVGLGILVLVGVGLGDAETDAEWIAEKVAHLRIFPDDAGAMNRSVMEAGGAALVVSQFTLYGDARRGRRPSFASAAPPEEANRLYVSLVARLRARGVAVQTGVFGAMMDVALVNQGPVTVLLDSRKGF